VDLLPRVGIISCFQCRSEAPGGRNVVEQLTTSNSMKNTVDLEGFVTLFFFYSAFLLKKGNPKIMHHKGEGRSCSTIRERDFPDKGREGPGGPTEGGLD